MKILMAASIIPVRVALTGFGQLAAEVHLPVLRRMAGVELVAIADPETARRALARQLFPRARFYEDQAEMLSQSEFDSVVISAPPQVHQDLALAALAQGKHVYLEKPAAITVAGALNLVEVWRCTDRTGMIGFNYRFNRLIQSAREQIRAGRVGNVRFLRSAFSLSSRAMPVWKKSRRSGGGVLLDLASHHVDLIRHLCGSSIDEVSARIWSQQTEDDCAALRLTLSNNVTVLSFFSLCTVDEDTIEIYGDRGKLTVDRCLSQNVQFTSVAQQAGLGQGLKNLISQFLPNGGFLEKLRSPLHEPSYAAAMARFVARVRGSNDEYPDFEDGLRCQEALEAAEESSRTGRTVPCAANLSA